MRQNGRVDDSLRFQIIEEYLKGSSKYSLQKKYGLGSSNNISYWMRIFGISDPKNASMKQKKEESANEELCRLRQENKELKASLTRARMEADVYNTLIDVAEEQLQISIRKKPGTKQS